MGAMLRGMVNDMVLTNTENISVLDRVGCGCPRFSALWFSWSVEVCSACEIII